MSNFPEGLSHPSHTHFFIWKYFSLILKREMCRLKSVTLALASKHNSKLNSIDLKVIIKLSWFLSIMTETQRGRSVTVSWQHHYLNWDKLIACDSGSAEVYGRVLHLHHLQARLENGSTAQFCTVLQIPQITFNATQNTTTVVQPVKWKEIDLWRQTMHALFMCTVQMKHNLTDKLDIVTECVYVCVFVCLGIWFDRRHRDSMVSVGVP